MSEPNTLSLPLEALSLEPSSQQQQPTTSMYTSLNSARSEVRLLEILPRVTDDAQEQVRCKLSIHSLDMRPSYTALSYVWGDPKKTETIIVNGCEMSATANLVHALLQQREDDGRMVWADALCIKQDDDVEKAQQIQMMGTIYRQAASVMAWLGQSDETTERALQNLSNIHEAVLRLDLHTLREPRLFTWPRDDVRRAGMALLQALSDEAALERGDLGLVMSFFERPYWTRVWVIQELCLASAARLHCGRYSIQWEVVEAVVAALSLLRFIAEDVPEESTMATLDNLCFPYAPEFPTWERAAAAHVSVTLRTSVDSSISMWDLLDFTSNNTDLASEDPRDRIFALHGMLSEEDRSGFEVDLSMTWEELYTKITTHMLLQYGPKLFEFCGLGYQAKPPLLPSWVVDWRCTKERESVDPWNVKKLSVPYRFQTYGQNMIIVEAAFVGHVVAIVPFSGRVTDLPQFVDQIEHTSAQLATSSSLLPRPANVWQELMIDGEITDDDARQFDIFARQIASIELSSDDISMTGEPITKIRERMLDDYCQQAIRTLEKSTLFITDRGDVGHANRFTDFAIGDALYVFLDDTAPLLLRDATKDAAHPAWSLVGRAHVMAMMRWHPEGDFIPFNMDKFWETNPSLGNISLI